MSIKELNLKIFSLEFLEEIAASAKSKTTEWQAAGTHI
jgi:hypothetical protein